MREEQSHKKENRPKSFRKAVSKHEPLPPPPSRRRGNSPPPAPAAGPVERAALPRSPFASASPAAPATSPHRSPFANKSTSSASPMSIFSWGNKSSANVHQNESSAVDTPTEVALGKQYPTNDDQMKQRADRSFYNPRSGLNPLRKNARNFRNIFDAADGEDDGTLYEVDCGHSLGNPILSHKHAMRVHAFNHAGIVNEDGISLTPYPLNANFGWFDYPLRRCFSSEPPSSGILEKYGIGTMLWFKFLKAFSVIFFVMFLITLPSILFYWNGVAVTFQERSYVVQTSPTDMVVLSTFGSFVASHIQCYDVKPLESTHVSCYHGHIGSIVGYYGDPQGTCSCPSVQVPNAGKTCPGKIKERNGHEECELDRYGNPIACFYSNINSELSDPQPCCAFDKVDGKPDLSNLDIAPNYQCNSATAQRILDGVCSGRAECDLVADPNFVYSWIHEGSEPLVDICSQGTVQQGEQCNTTLASVGFFGGCGSGGEKRRLLVQAICINDEVKMWGGYISKEKLVLIASILNAVAVLALVLGIAWVYDQQEKAVDFFDRNTCRAMDYTVQTDNIPPHTNAHDLAKKLKRHFEKTLTNIEPCYLPGKVKVADINFTTGSYNMLHAAIKRGSFARELDEILYRKTLPEYEKSSLYARWLDFREEHCLKNYNYYNHLCEQYADGGKAAKKVMRAYITFESEEGFLRCLKAFPSSTLSTYFYSDNIDVDGVTMTVSQANDPSDIIWEHLGTPTVSKVLRRSLTMLLLFGMLIATYLIINKAIREGEKFEANFPFFIDCRDFKIDLDKNNVNNTAANVITYWDTIRDVNWQYYNNTMGKQGYLQCYCREVQRVRGVRSMLRYEFYDVEEDKDQLWCEEVVFGYLSVQSIRALVAVVIVAVNISAKSILRMFKDFERHGYISAISEAMTYKLALIQIANTGLLVLLINGSTSGGLNSEDVTLLNGQYKDFSYGWYEDVGKSLMGTMILYMFGVHGLKALMAFKQKLLRYYDNYFTNNPHLTRKVTQEQLDRLYLGPEFVVEVRYATALTLAFVCVVYASTMPFMYLIAAAGYTLMYFIDKYYLLRISRLPNALSPQLSLNVTRLIYIAAMMNLCFGIWGFSNYTLFSPDLIIDKEMRDVGGVMYYSVEHRIRQDYPFYERLFNFYTIPHWIVLGPVILFILSHAILILLRKFRVTTIFSVKEYEGNPEYFDAIPIPVIRKRVHDGIVKRHIMDRYRKRLSEYENGEVEEEPKLLDGLESYDIGTNDMYADKIALNSTYIQKRRPKDLFSSDLPDEENQQQERVLEEMKSDKQFQLKNIVPRHNETFVIRKNRTKQPQPQQQSPPAAAQRENDQKKVVSRGQGSYIHMNEAALTGDIDDPNMSFRDMHGRRQVSDSTIGTSVMEVSDSDIAVLF